MEAPHNLVLRTLRQLAADPLSESEVDQLYLPAWNPELLPEDALNLLPSGLPKWWPDRSPLTAKCVSEARRLRWCVEVLAGALSPVRGGFLAAEVGPRKRTVARCLLDVYVPWTAGAVPTHGWSMSGTPRHKLYLTLRGTLPPIG